MKLSYIIFAILFYSVVNATAPGAYKIYERYGAGDAYLAISRGKYTLAWYYCNQPNKQNPVHELLKARILGDQGAYYLATDIWNKLQNKIVNLNDHQLSLEYFLLGCDIKYQLYEFEQYLKIVKEYSKHLDKTRPSDSLFYAIEASMKLKYFSALIEPDSGRKYSANAINIYRRNKLTEANFPVWLIYANQVSACRNEMVQISDLGPEMQDNFSDTCMILINRWYPEITIEKLRIMQANDIRFFDRCSSRNEWISNPAFTQSNFEKLNNSYKHIRHYYQKLIGARHGFISQISYLLSLSNFSKGDFNKVLSELENADYSNYSSDRREAIFCTNWRRKLGFSKIETRVFKNEEQNATALHKCLKILAILKQHEEIHYLRILHGLINRDIREDDKYLVVPFQMLQFYSIKAYKLSGKKKYLDDAWDYCQKAKYSDLNRKRLKDANHQIPVLIQKFANIKMDEIRRMNDSLLLRNNEFKPFLFIHPLVLEKRIDKAYDAFGKTMSRLKYDDPIAGKYLHGKHSYTINKLQESLHENNLGRIEISNLSHEDTLINMMWYITADTVYCEFIKFNEYKDYLPLSLAAENEKALDDEWPSKSALFYTKYLKKGFNLFRNKNISRIIVSHDPNYGDFPMEIFSTDLSNNSWLLNEFAFSYSLGVVPDKAKINNVPKVSSKGILFVIPELPEHLMELTYANKQVVDFSKKFNLEIKSGKFNKKDLIKALQNYSIVQLFSHGEKTGEIWLSDGKITSKEIRELKSSADFVSLTSCESWHGKLYRNDGVEGMVEALEHAGTRKQVASFWKIDEKISVDIMLSFYEKIFKGYPLDVCMREAKLTYLNKGNKQELSPIYWGGLAVFGDNSPLMKPEKPSGKLQWLWIIIPIVIIMVRLKRNKPVR